MLSSLQSFKKVMRLFLWGCWRHSISIQFIYTYYATRDVNLHQYTMHVHAWCFMNMLHEWPFSLYAKPCNQLVKIYISKASHNIQPFWIIQSKAHCSGLSAAWVELYGYSKTGAAFPPCGLIFFGAVVGFELCKTKDQNGNFWKTNTEQSIICNNKATLCIFPL